MQENLILAPIRVCFAQFRPQIFFEVKHLG